MKQRGYEATGRTQGFHSWATKAIANVEATLPRNIVTSLP
jgi:hypothetical protein